MNKAKKVYVYSDGKINGSMVRDFSRYKKSLQTIDPYIYRGKLRLHDICSLNNGSYFVFNGEDGKQYYMTDNEFNKYLRYNNVFIDGNFEFLQQGSIQSIGGVRDNV